MKNFKKAILLLFLLINLFSHIVPFIPEAKPGEPPKPPIQLYGGGDPGKDGKNGS